LSAQESNINTAANSTSSQDNIFHFIASNDIALSGN
jgi:hypothetical protein